MNNKKYLALAISAIMFSGIANATIDLNDSNDDSKVFAGEIDLSSGDANLTTSGNIFNVKVRYGVAIPQSVVRYIRFDLDNGATYTSISAPVPQTGGTGTVPTIALEGGGTGVGFAVYKVTVGGGAPDAVIDAATDYLKFDVDGIKVVNQGPVKTSYSIYMTHLNALNKIAPIVAVSEEKIITFKDALSLKCTPNVSPENIDVVQSSLFFTGSTGDDSTVIGDFGVVLDASNYLQRDGTAIDISDVSTTTKLTVTGSNGWSAVTSLSDGGSTFALTAGEFVAATAAPAALATFTATVPAANAVAIAESEITIKSEPTALTGYTVDTITGSCNLGKLEKNGSKDRLTFALTPGGAYKNFIRITNPSSTDGDVFLTVTDDTGAMATFPMGDIASVPADLLAAGASTSLVTIDEVGAAAKAANAALDITTKLRINVDAEFGATTAGDGSKDTSGVNIQAFSMSQDNNAFFMMQKD